MYSLLYVHYHTYITYLRIVRIGGVRIIIMERAMILVIYL